MTGFIIILLVACWATLMIRSSIAELRYYRSIRLQEPLIWSQLGTKYYPWIPFVLVTKARKQLLESIEKPEIVIKGQTYQRAGRQFIAFVAVVLLVAIVYFSLAPL